MKTTLPDKDKDYTGWYNSLVKQAGLIDEGPVRGTMIMKPYGYALWERIQQSLDQAFKASGHVNAYFPLLIPASYLSREAKHVEGFAKECAVVTHHRLKQSADKQGVVIDPEAKLEEPLIVRPTSETVIWDAYSRWIQSYRDLPVLINQWANIVRWEMRTRPFLRTTEILWQEGHTAHSTAEEAKEEALRMRGIYADFIREQLSIPVVQGEKTAHERFAGADITYTLEALMQDGKALQMCTSHFLGQHFAKAFDVQFLDEHGKQNYVWGTSWGATTRLIGAMIMTHGDKHGLVLPPALAPIQVVIIPIHRTPQQREEIIAKAQELADELRATQIRTRVDADERHSPGWKFAEHELKGIPLRLTLGPRDLVAETIEVCRRDTREKHSLPIYDLPVAIQNLLTDIQENLLACASRFQATHTTTLDDFQAFQDHMRNPCPGFVLAHWDGTTETEQKIQELTQATIRCIPADQVQEPGHCIFSGKPSQGKVFFAKAY